MVVPENLRKFDTLELTQNLKISKNELIEKIESARTIFKKITLCYRAPVFII